MRTRCKQYQINVMDFVRMRQIFINITNKMNNHRFGRAMPISYANKYINIYANKIFTIQVLNSYSIHENLMSLYSKLIY
jgi:hypothetical protein